MQTVLKALQGTFNLQRLPLRKNEKLRAWDAADEYLLSHVAENELITTDSRVIVLNDSFGALAIALNACQLVAISDSYLSHQASLHNLQANDVDKGAVEFRSSLDWPEQVVDVVLIKIPKTMALLEDQLIRLQPLLSKQTMVIAAGMVKAMPATVWKLMSKYLGETTPSLAKKKARLIFIESNRQPKVFENPYPVVYALENTQYRIVNHANVFSRERLDIGTRFLLAHLPKNTVAQQMVDLGCGNGVVGLMLAESHPASFVSFIDESYMAVTSAQETFQSAFKDRKAHFLVANGLAGFEKESIDLIVCNPPFHQQNTVGNQIALSLFRQSYNALRQGGEFWVIGNRHLGYHLDLKRLFGHCSEVAANTKFVIWRVVKN